MVEFVDVEVKKTKSKLSRSSKGLLFLTSLIHFLGFNVVLLSYLKYDGILSTLIFIVLEFFIFYAIFKRSNLNNNSSIILILTIINILKFGLFSFITLLSLSTVMLTFIYIYKIKDLR